MYGWIWRHLPYGRPGKLVGSLLLVVATGLLLWYVVFPAIDPLLPFNSSQVTTQDQGPAGPQGGADTLAPSSAPVPSHGTAGAHPSPSRSR